MKSTYSLKVVGSRLEFAGRLAGQFAPPDPRVFPPKVMAPDRSLCRAFKNLSTRRRDKLLESWGAAGGQARRPKTDGFAPSNSARGSVRASLPAAQLPIRLRT